MELLARFKDRVKEVKPDRPLHGVTGHMWEQFILPAKIGNQMLWSPSNTGPLAVEKQILTVHDLSFMDHPEWMAPRFVEWYRFLTPRLLRRVSGVLAVSEFTKQRIIEYCPDIESKIKVVHQGVDARFQPALVESINKMRLNLRLPSQEYIVALGSIEPRKNLQRLLQAWKIIYSKIPDNIWLVLAGARGDKIVFGDISLGTIPPRVHFTGHVPDEFLPALYSGAIASPYLSLYEGFGLPPLEAMACGVPVLTSNSTSLPEVVGTAAITVDPYDVEAIAAELVRLTEDDSLRRELRHRGMERAKQFNWDKTAEQTWRILQAAAQL